MTEVCPYCRAPIASDEPVQACEGCGTRHHADCYAENGGCTIFGCAKAPAEEPKLTVSSPEVTGMGAGLAVAPVVAVSTVPTLSPIRTQLPPPPPSIAAETSVAELRQIANRVVPSMFNAFTGEGAAEPEVVATREPKSRTTFIVLGALLGALGLHNFYAGYHKKAAAQLALTICTLGFASPMSWIWAIIDVCTVNQDSYGIQFES